MTVHLLTLVVISASAQCFLAALWYGVIFKKSWVKLIGSGVEQSPKSQVFRVVATFIACFLLSFMLAHILALASSITAMDGASIGVVCWFGFIGPPSFAQHIWEGRRANLFAINAAYWLVAMAIGGAILAVFH
jgi:hypothetical protein